MRELICYHMIALVTGCVLDLCIGDPHGIPHPVVGIGRMISALEKRLYPVSRTEAEEESREGSFIVPSPGRMIRLGFRLWITVMIVAVLITMLMLAAAYLIHPYAGIAVEAVLTCYILAARSLYDESMKVCKDLERGDTDAARGDLSMIVGRDTDRLDETGMIRAAVETVAENTSDGVLAPLLYTILGGPVLGMMYKAVNTMDSMLGYHNDRYEYFGRFAAKADDVFNFVPSRMSAWFIMASAAVLGLFSNDISAAGAYRIWRRDRQKHLSPNSAQTESACAGSLGIRLGGTSYYGGVPVEKPSIGDDDRQIETAHIRYANRLMFTSELLMFIIFGALYLIVRKGL